jgi:hypothetical protein
LLAKGFSYASHAIVISLVAVSVVVGISFSFLKLGWVV